MTNIEGGKSINWVIFQISIDFMLKTRSHEGSSSESCCEQRGSRAPVQGKAGISVTPVLVPGDGMSSQLRWIK